jgi:DNA-binding NarL/FixJ family response regulator
MPSKAKSKADKQLSEAVARKSRVVIVDDHALIRQGLAQLLNTRPNLSVIGEADSAGAGLDLVRKYNPDLVILDLSLAKADGLEVVKQLKAELPKLPILVISMHDESVYAERVLRAGARGYVMKKEPSEKIFLAVDALLRGEIFVSDRIKQDMLQFTATGKRASNEGGEPLDHLTDREMQVFRRLGDGISTREIAQELHLSVKTIETYRESLKVKLNVPTGAALIQRAIQWARTQSR